jgi:hypothetical protein
MEGSASLQAISGEILSETQQVHGTEIILTSVVFIQHLLEDGFPRGGVFE